MATSQGRRQEIRARMAETGEPYSVARRAIEADPVRECLACRRRPSDLEPVSADASPYRVAGWKCGDCSPLRVDELGVAALGADATPEQKARAEALWRPVLNPDQPCRCSGGSQDGSCRHGRPCMFDDEDDDCGRLVHIDRHAEGMFSGVETWWDTYECAECGERWFQGEVLPDVPWGTLKPNPAGGYDFTTFPDIRHPNFLDTFPGMHSSRTEPPFTPDDGGQGRNDVMCVECGLTWAQICPECPGCACIPPSQCSGWRHQEWYADEDDWDDADEDAEEREYA